MSEVLPSLIRIKRWRVDEKRRTLSELSLRVESLRAEADRLEREIGNEQALDGANPNGAGLAYAAYARVAAERRRHLAQAIANAEAECAHARDDLRRAFLELKTIEIALANRERRRIADAEHRQRVALDEIALQRHTRA